MLISRRDLLAASPLLFFPAGLLRAARPDAAVAGQSVRFDEFTRESEECAQRGTAWMLKTIHSRSGGCGVDIGQPEDIGCTAIVGLALLSQGNTPMEGPHYRQVQKIRDYLLGCIDNMPSDDITSSTHTQLQNKIGRHAHSFFASLFLSQVMGEGDDPSMIRDRLGKLVDTICRAQTANGDWGGQSWAPTLGTVMGWLCLRAAHLAGYKVEASANKTAEHLIQVMRSRLTQNRGSWMHTLYKNATGIRVLYAMGKEDDPVAKKAFEDVERVVTQDNTPFSQAGGEEYLAFHLITETMLQKGGNDWKRWFPVVRDKVCKVQNRDGSWTGMHCITSRTFCTAAAVLVLIAPNRYLPISQQ